MYDVIVIGGGPAGMMAAGRASEQGAKVLLLEKNSTLGKKLLITGGGRSNATNAEPDRRKLLSKFRNADKFLFSPFSIFDNKNAIAFFNDRDMETKIENDGRVFPTSNTAQSVLDVLLKYMKTGSVEVRSHSEVGHFVHTHDTITAVQLKDDSTLQARSFVLATGGMSRPETGSTGDGFRMLREIGHTVKEPNPSLVPLAIKDTWVTSLSGITLPDVKIRILQNSVKQAEARGKILFTHVGVSGPTILNLSKDVADLLSYGEVEISLDVFPEEDFSTLNEKLQELFKNEANKLFKNALSSLLPTAIAKAVVNLSGISGDTRCNSITREERIILMKLLKDMRMKVAGLLGEDKAIVTSGGVVLSEVDFKTMQSKLFPNLYLIGDILDIDRPSGGYSLQLCWTTGYVAGNTLLALN